MVIVCETPCIVMSTVIHPVMWWLCRQASAELGDRVEVSLDNVTGEASLLVRGVSLGDGGLYKCEVTLACELQK